MPAAEERRDRENLEIKSFNALSEEERFNRTRELQIVHAAKNGLFGVQLPSALEKSYRVIYDFDPANILAIFTRSLKNVDATTIINEDKKRAPTVR